MSGCTYFWEQLYIVWEIAVNVLRACSDRIQNYVLLWVSFFIYFYYILNCIEVLYQWHLGEHIKYVASKYWKTVYRISLFNQLLYNGDSTIYLIFWNYTLNWLKSIFQELFRVVKLLKFKKYDSVIIFQDKLWTFIATILKMKITVDVYAKWEWSYIIHEMKWNLICVFKFAFYRSAKIHPILRNFVPYQWFIV